MPKHGVSSSSNGSDNDAQQGTPEAGAQAGPGVEENENRPRALEAIPEEASASPPDDEHQLNIDMEADPSSDFMRQFAADGHLNPLGEATSSQVLQDPPAETARRSTGGDSPSNGAPANKRFRDNSEVLQDTPPSSTTSNLPYPLVDALVLKDHISGDPDINPDRAYPHMMEKIGSRYKLCGVVTLFQHPESYVDRRLVNEPPEGVATVTECEDDEVLYPNNLVAGAVIGCEPSEAEFLTDSVWFAISGLATSGYVGKYKIVGLYTGIDLSSLKRDKFESDEAFAQAEVETAQAQGQWLTKFATLAAQLHIPLSVYIDHTTDNTVDAFDTTLHLLKQVKGLSKTHRICLTQYELFPEPAELFLQHFPNTVIGVTRSLVQNAPHCPRTKAWLARVPWEHLIFESQAPTLQPLNADDNNHNDSADCLQLMASHLADITGEHAMVIIHRMTMAAISHYGLLAVNPRLLEGTRIPTTPPAVNRMALWQYQEHLLSRPGGLAEPAPVHPDIMYGIQMPEMPWYVLQDAPQAPVKESQAGPLPDIPVPPYTAPDLRQPGVFMVNDQSDTSFEYLKRCNDHDRKPGIRYHATVRSVVDDWKKFESDSNATPDMVGLRRKLGNRTINSFGKMHLVCSASRFMRHHATQVAQFIDQVLNTWDRVQLERIVCQFFDSIRTLEVARGDKAFTEGKREERVERESIKFSKAEVLMALRWWVLRCEPGRAYFVENIHGAAWYDTAFLSSPGVDAGIRDSFRETLIGAFTDRLDHARLRYFLEEVTKEHQAPQGPHGSARWPPWVLQYAVDFRRTYWSNSVVLMDQWARSHFGPNLRIDIDAIELDSDPTQASEAISRLFFGAAVEQIVLFYGKDALDKGKARELWQFYPKVVDHLTRCFGRARVFIVTPAFIFYVMKEWKEAVKTAVIDNEDLQRLAGVVIHPTDLRLEAYFDQHGPEAGWPNETLALQDRNGTLLRAGVLERKRRIVEEYGLELWTDEGLEPEFMLSEEELLDISRLSVGMTVRHFGAPTVPGTEYEERMPKPPKAREAKTLGGYPAILGGRTPAVRPDKGSESAPPAKAKPPANVGLSLPWEQVKDLLQQETAKFRLEWEAELKALKAQRASAHASHLEATQPTSTQKLGIKVAPPPASTPKPKGTPRPPAASKQQKGAKALNSPGFSPSSKSLAAEKMRDSTQGRRSEGPHALRQATTIRVAAAASLIAASTSTTTSTTSAASTPSTTSTSSAATTGTSAATTGTSSASSGTSAATTGTSSGSSASGLPSSAESLPAARQPEEGDEAMPADDE